MQWRNQLKGEFEMATKVRKQEIVSDLRDVIGDGKVIIVTDLSGLTVAELQQFRRKLDKDNAKCHIAKNTLIKIASNDGPFASVKELAKGPTALVIGLDDPAAPAKTVVNFIKDLKKGEIRGAVLDGNVISEKEVKNLAELPSKEQLLASIMGGLDSGARNIAGMLEAIIRDIAVMSEEVAKKNNAA
jgi:large subunit ribosomal protein L10